jgi:hypothetical protein
MTSPADPSSCRAGTRAPRPGTSAVVGVAVVLGAPSSLMDGWALLSWSRNWLMPACAAVRVSLVVLTLAMFPWKWGRAGTTDPPAEASRVSSTAADRRTMPVMHLSTADDREAGMADDGVGTLAARWTSVSLCGVSPSPGRAFLGQTLPARPARSRSCLMTLRHPAMPMTGVCPCVLSCVPLGCLLASAVPLCLPCPHLSSVALGHRSQVDASHSGYCGACALASYSLGVRTERWIATFIFHLFSPVLTRT